MGRAVIEPRDIVKALGGRGDMAHCPCHKDRSPSLSVRGGKTQPIIVHCHAGCDSGAVIAALCDMNLWPPNGSAGAEISHGKVATTPLRPAINGDQLHRELERA